MVNMVRGCDVPRCTNTTNGGYSLINIPVDEPTREKWIELAGGKWEPKKGCRFCEIHFDPVDFYRVGRKKCLKKGSVPKYFCTCPIPSSLERKLKKNRRIAVPRPALADHDYTPLPSPATGPISAPRFRNFPHIPTCVVKKPPVPLESLSGEPFQSQLELQVLRKKLEHSISNQQTLSTSITALKRELKLHKLIRMKPDTRRKIGKSSKLLKVWATLENPGQPMQPSNHNICARRQNQL